MNSHIKEVLFRSGRVVIVSIFILAQMYQAGPVSLIRPANASDDWLGDAMSGALGFLGSAADTITGVFSPPSASWSDPQASYESAASPSTTPESYSSISPLDAIGQYTNPIMEDIFGMQAGSAEAQEWGTGVYQLTGGLINLPMVGLFGKSLDDTSSTGTMSPAERLQYVLDHPLEAVEYVAGVATGASLVNGIIAGTGTTALTGSLAAASEAITEANGLGKVSAVARVVTDPLISASKTVLTYGTLTGVAACATNAITGNYQVGQDASGKPVIVDPNGKPQVVDTVSATAYGMGATVLHAATGDPKAAAFAQAMNSQGLSNTLSKSAEDLKTNGNPGGTVLSIPVQMAKSVVDFAEFPITAVDTVASAERQGWSEGAAKGGLAEAVIQSDIEGAKAVGGVILGVVSFPADVASGIVNSAESAIGGDGRVLQSNWLAQTVTNAPFIKDLGLGEYAAPVSPNGPEYLSWDFSVANGLFLLGGRASEREAKTATDGAVSPESVTGTYREFGTTEGMKDTSDIGNEVKKETVDSAENKEGLTQTQKGKTAQAQIATEKVNPENADQSGQTKQETVQDAVTAPRNEASQPEQKAVSIEELKTNGDSATEQVAVVQEDVKGESSAPAVVTGDADKLANAGYDTQEQLGQASFDQAVLDLRYTLWQGLKEGLATSPEKTASLLPGMETIMKNPLHAMYESKADPLVADIGWILMNAANKGDTKARDFVFSVLRDSAVDTYTKQVMLGNGFSAFFETLMLNNRNELANNEVSKAVASTLNSLAFSDRSYAIGEAAINGIPLGVSEINAHSLVDMIAGDKGAGVFKNQKELGDFIGALDTYKRYQDFRGGNMEVSIDPGQAARWSYASTAGMGIPEIFSGSGHVAVHVLRDLPDVQVRLEQGVLTSKASLDKQVRADIERRTYESGWYTWLVTNYVHTAVDHIYSGYNDRGAYDREGKKYALVFPLETLLEENSFYLAPFGRDGACDDFPVRGELPVQSGVLLYPASEREQLNAWFSKMEGSNPGWQRPDKIFFYDANNVVDGFEQLSKEYNLAPQDTRISISGYPRITGVLSGEHTSDVIIFGGAVPTFEMRISPPDPLPSRALSSKEPEPG